MATSYLFSVFRGRSGARWILTQCRRSEERFRGFRGSPLTIQSTLFAMGVGGLMLGGVHFAMLIANGRMTTVTSSLLQTACAI